MERVKEKWGKWKILKGKYGNNFKLKNTTFVKKRYKKNHASIVVPHIVRNSILWFQLTTKNRCYLVKACAALAPLHL